jgi:hypothetical protein
LDPNAILQIADEDWHTNQSKRKTATGKFPGQNEAAFQSKWSGIGGKMTIKMKSRALMARTKIEMLLPKAVSAFRKKNQA